MDRLTLAVTRGEHTKLLRKMVAKEGLEPPTRGL